MAPMTERTFIELGEILLVLLDFREEFHTLLDNILADDLKDLVLLKSLTRYVEGKVLRVDDTFHEVEVFGDQILTIIHDEDTTDIELDVIPLLLGFEEVERCTEYYVRL
jgi:hypothetical protein